MVHGLELFKKKFANFPNMYVFIGGTACEIILNSMGSSFRATKDLDIVLILEEINEKFAVALWEFITEGQYQHKCRHHDGDQYYRFIKPGNPEYPKMIELFSRKPDKTNLCKDAHLTPVHLDDDVASLSAILLNDLYYDLLRSGSEIIDGFSVLSLPLLIVFKIRAWLDLTNKFNTGIKIDSSDIKKHKNDILRLAIEISPGTKFILEKAICFDIEQFIDCLQNENSTTSIGGRAVLIVDIITILHRTFL